MRPGAEVTGPNALAALGTRAACCRACRHWGNICSSPDPLWLGHLHGWQLGDRMTDYFQKKHRKGSGAPTKKLHLKEMPIALLKGV